MCQDQVRSVGSVASDTPTSPLRKSQLARYIYVAILSHGSHFCNTLERFWIPLPGRTTVGKVSANPQKNESEHGILPERTSDDSAPGRLSGCPLLKARAMHIIPTRRSTPDNIVLLIGLQRVAADRTVVLDRLTLAARNAGVCFTGLEEQRRCAVKDDTQFGAQERELVLKIGWGFQNAGENLGGDVSGALDGSRGNYTDVYNMLALIALGGMRTVAGGAFANVDCVNIASRAGDFQDLSWPFRVSDALAIQYDHAVSSQYLMLRQREWKWSGSADRWEMARS